MSTSQSQNGELLIVMHGNDLEYLNIALNIFEDQKRFYNEIKFVDISNILSKQDTFSRGLLKIIGKSSPDDIIFKKLESLGLNISRTLKKNLTELQNSVPSASLNSINESVQSSLISISENENPENSRWLVKRKARYLREGIITYNAIKNYLKINTHITHVAIPNGRFPCQCGAVNAVMDSGLKFISYERGTYENEISDILYSHERYLVAKNYWYSSYTPQSRIEKQREILSMNIEPELINSSKVNEWFLSRRQSSGTNRFAQGWNQSYDIDSTSKLAVLFTSSVDEFAVMGPSWREAKWKDQWQAFDFLIPKLLEQKYKIVLRVHPNLHRKRKKSRKTTELNVRLLARKFPKIYIVNPSSKVNSYKLVEKAEIVFSWYSTISLEASQMGVRSVCLNSSEYDLVADVKRWHSVEEIDFKSLQNWTVDKTGALKYIAGLFLLDNECKKLLLKYGINSQEYSKGLALFANKWAMRNTNKPTNLISILIPKKLFLKLRKIKNIKYALVEQ